MLRKWLARWLGLRGEDFAAKHLRALGYIIIARNHRSRYGELDLIARDGNTLVFVEVKTRKSDAYGSPLEAVTAEKQRQISRAALAWLKWKKLLNQRTRFDVVGLVWEPDANSPKVTHIKHAFECAVDW